MQMVDTITDISNTHVVTEFEVKSTCIFVEEGKFAEVGLIENMAQTCSAIVGQFLFGIEDTSNYVIGYISAIKKLEIFTLPCLRYKRWCAPKLNCFLVSIPMSITSARCAVMPL